MSRTGDRLSATARTPLVQLRHRPAADAAEAMDEPFAAFPSWFLRIECECCFFKDRMLNESHATDRQREMPIRVLLARCPPRRLRRKGGRPPVELMTGIEGASSRPVRRIVACPEADLFRSVARSLQPAGP